MERTHRTLSPAMGLKSISSESGMRLGCNKTSLTWAAISGTSNGRPTFWAASLVLVTESAADSSEVPQVRDIVKLLENGS